MNQHLRVFLEFEAERLLKPVKDFAGITTVYEGKYDREFSEKCLESFHLASEAAAEWVRKSVLMEAAENEDGDLPERIELMLPDTVIEVSAGAYKNPGFFSGDFCCSVRPADDVQEPLPNDTMMTPIGKLRPYVYEAVTEIKGNPVEVFYRHLSSMTGILHERCGSGVLTGGLLLKHGMNDPLKIYKMDLLLRDIDQFFKGKQYRL